MIRFGRPTHSGEQLNVLADNPFTGFLIRFQRPDTTFGRPTNCDAVRSRHHVETNAIRSGGTAWSACCPVVDLRLRYKMGELSLEGHKLLVGEQRACTKTCTVNDDRFTQRHQIALCVEFANDDLASK